MNTTWYSKRSVFEKVLGQSKEIRKVMCFSSVCSN